MFSIVRLTADSAISSIAAVNVGDKMRYPTLATITVALMFAATLLSLILSAPAHSEEEYTGEYIWYYDCRHAWVAKDLTRTVRDKYNTPPVEASETHAHIEREEFDKMLKVFPRLLRQMKACDAYRTCLANRYAGKVKHCHVNDRRWREFITGDW
jgi:hypothetical protein